MRRLPLVVLLLVLAACDGPATPSGGGRSGTPAIQGTAPAVQMPPVGPSQPAEVAALLSRAVRLPSLAPGATCPRTAPTSRSPVAQEADATGFGGAPLFPIGMYMDFDATVHLGDATPGPDGLYEAKVVWANVPYQGPVVVRAGRLDGPGRAQVQIYAHPEWSAGDAAVFPLIGSVGDWPSGTFVSGPGCFAYQIDGATFSEVVVFRVVR